MAIAASPVASGVVAAHSNVSDTAARTTPNTKAARGDTTPEGIGRLRVRDISRSMSRSYQQLKTLAAPAANIPPTIVAATSRQEGHPSAAIIIAGRVVTSTSSTSLGLVSDT